MKNEPRCLCYNPSIKSVNKYFSKSHCQDKCFGCCFDFRRRFCSKPRLSISSNADGITGSVSHLEISILTEKYLPPKVWFLATHHLLPFVILFSPQRTKIKTLKSPHPVLFRLYFSSFTPLRQPISVDWPINKLWRI